MIPSHFAERFGLIVIIAIGESIVAIGAGVEQEIDAGIVVAAVLGMAVAAALWWLYFDVVALVAERRLLQAEPGREQNSIGRDSYGYLHLPMVAGIVLIALGMKKTLGDIGDPLKTVPAVALLGGAAMYLLAHVAFRYRNIATLNRQRLVARGAVPRADPAREGGRRARHPRRSSPSCSCALIAYETLRFAELRDRIRHEVAREMHAGTDALGPRRRRQTLPGGHDPLRGRQDHRAVGRLAHRQAQLEPAHGDLERRRSTGRA